jgi:hypothetical protein
MGRFGSATPYLTDRYCPYCDGTKGGKLWRGKRNGKTISAKHERGHVTAWPFTCIPSDVFWAPAHEFALYLDPCSLCFNCLPLLSSTTGPDDLARGFLSGAVCNRLSSLNAGTRSGL